MLKFGITKNPTDVLQEVYLSEYIIASSNMRGILKPKGNVSGQVVLLLHRRLTHQGRFT